MKILCSEYIQQANPFISELYGAILKVENNIEFVWGMDNFWYADPENYDILHLHWPERFFNFRIENQKQLKRLDTKLQEWSSSVVIVANIHNLVTHRNHPIDEDLFRTTYSYVDNFIHFGQKSKDLVTLHYQDDLKENCNHHIIPHGIYTQYKAYEKVSKEQIREELGIPKDCIVLLSFGKIRHDKERELIFRVFRNCRAKNKQLIVGGSFFKFKNLTDRLLLKFYKFTSKIKVLQWVKNENVGKVFKAADIFFSPRIFSLNSGTLLLGFSFANVLVGPNNGVIGEVLKETGNPVYEPHNTKSAIKAVEEAIALLGQKKGEYNYQYANKHWNWEKLVYDYLSIYKGEKSLRDDTYEQL